MAKLVIIGLGILILAGGAAGVYFYLDHAPERANLPTETLILEVNGMSCGGCAMHIQESLVEAEGVVEAKVSFESQQAVITYAPAKVTPRELVTAVEKAGYHANVATAAAP
ncbi:MAG: heavy-metal-associated domain-containing protein [Gemmatimonadetes bacterium]|nr:MAG: heavy-metal-associated domain-containing protein [Gemmatimonadota bacterium]